eukprot:5513498-Pleurochrysis_carterae.AAC.1
MDMRGTRRGMHAAGREELNELVRQKLAGIVAECIEGSKKTADVCRGLRFVLEEGNRLESGMIVDKHQKVLKASVLRADERTRNVCVYEPSR